MKWFKTRDEDLLAKARALLEEVEARPLEVHVPALLLYEIGNILLLKTRLGPSALDDAIDHLEMLPLVVASFLAPAVELDCPYVTADRRLFDRARSLPRVRHLSRVGSLT